MTEHYARQREYCPCCTFMRLTVDASGLCRSCREGDDAETEDDVYAQEEADQFTRVDQKP